MSQAFAKDKVIQKQKLKASTEQGFILYPESPLNKESLDLSQALFIGETSLSTSLRNPLEGTSGGNTCSSCSH